MNNPQAEKMTPLARRVAAEQNLDIQGINGSGYAGKINTSDLKNVHNFVFENKPAIEQEPIDVDENMVVNEFIMPEFLIEPPYKENPEPIKIPQIGKLIEFPKSPSFLFEYEIPEQESFETKADEIDVKDTETGESREKQYTMLAFYIKSMAVLIKELSSLRFRLAETGDARLLIEGEEIGLQIDTGGDVTTSIIKDADKKTLEEIEKDIMVLCGRS